MSNNVIQNSFVSGELAPTMYARTDFAKYHSGAALMRNFFVDYRGGASTRSGTQYVGRVPRNATGYRLIPFQFSVLQSLILLFTDFKLQFVKNGGWVLESTSFDIANLFLSNPAVILLGSAPPWVAGDIIFINGVLGSTQINNNFYEVASITANRVVLGRTLDGGALNALNFSPYLGAGTATRVYSIATPYAAADLNTLKYSQSANVMTITHPSYAPQNLSRIADNNWTIAPITFGATAVTPVGLVVTSSGAGTTTFSYRVTSIDSKGQESAPSAVGSVAGVNISTTAGTNILSWTAAAGAVAYNVYKIGPSQLGPADAGQLFGFIGSTTTSVLFQDTNIVPNFAITPPVVANPLASENPSVNCYFQQRQVFASSNIDPQTFWMSQPGAFTNFNGSYPAQDSDAITGTLVSNEVNAIKSMLPMPGGLIMLTSKGAWQISGQGANAAVTPAGTIASPQAYNGASDVMPIVVNYDILYVQAKGSRVRDLAYNIYANIYTGTDISLISDHLFYGFTINQWAYTEEPYKIIWVVRSDGIMLSLTYLKEQEINGWAQHDTQGLFRTAASITEGQQDILYVGVDRVIDGINVSFVERMQERVYRNGVEDTWAVDAGLSNVPRVPLTTLALSDATGVAVFSPGVAVSWAVGDVIRVGGGIATITGINGNNATVNITRAITAVIPGTTNPYTAVAGSWSVTTPITSIFGLDHLEGMMVTGIADGNVVSPREVFNGTITLDNPATRVIIGLGFTAQLKTLPLDIPTAEGTIQGKRKKIDAVTLRLNQSRGLKVGRTFNTLVPIKEMTALIPLGQNVPFITGDERQQLDSLYDTQGQVCIQQDYPLPASVLGLISEITLGDSSK